MASPKALLGGVLGRFLFRETKVHSVLALSPHFRRIELSGESLRGVECRAGDKVEIFLPDVGMRTYSPLAWNTEQGSLTFLAFLHGNGPGSQWASRLQGGETVQIMSPRRSLSFERDSAEALVHFGDETSLGVTHALMTAHPTRPLRCVFEVEDPAEANLVLQTLGLQDVATLEARGAPPAHVGTRVEEALIALGEDAQLVLTGQAQAIQSLRAHLRAKGMGRAAKVRAYWAVGKAGLD